MACYACCDETTARNKRAAACVFQISQGWKRMVWRECWFGLREVLCFLLFGWLVLIPCQKQN